MKLSKAFILLLSVHFCSFTMHSQTLKGKVINQQNVGVIDASVYVKRVYRGTTTDSKGNFKLKLRQQLRDTDTLVISHVNYQSLKLSFLELQQRKFTIKLIPTVESLDEVTLETKRKRLKTYINYKELPPLDKGLYGFGYTVVEGQLYIIGGNATDKFNGLNKDVVLDPNISRFAGSADGANMQDMLSELDAGLIWKRFNENLYTYNIQEKKWETSPKKFIKRAYHNVHHYKGKLLVIGGKRLSVNRRFEYLENKIEEYSIEKEQIEIDKANPHKAINFGSFLYKDKIVVLGGTYKKLKDGSKQYDNKIHVYDLKSGYWYHIGYMPIPKETKGVLVDDTVYLFGGFNGVKLKDIESYNLRTGRWKIEGTLFKKEEKPSLAVNEHMIYIYVKNRILTFNTLTKELDQYLINLDVVEPEIFFADGKIYLLGGFVAQSDARIEPSVGFYSIDVKEFDITRLNKTKTF